MDSIDFRYADPHEKARSAITDVVDFGVDQVVVACAFVTAAGVEVLLSHAERFANEQSFIVVSAQPPTDLEALGKLNAAVPGHVYVHYGCTTPTEVHVGKPLMHSKVFYARAGEVCRLWTGSHNLTASATQGLNCEAAIELKGDANEQVFKDAYRHLLTCRAESLPYRPPPPKPPLLPGALVIHAETAEAVSAPPGFVHVCLPDLEYDEELERGVPAVLYLYPLGVLRETGPDPRKAERVFMGTQTAVNNTKSHPVRGIAGDWRDAQFIIECEDNLFRMYRSHAPQHPMTTQCICRFDQFADDLRSATWLTKKPKVEDDYETLDLRVSLDEDMRRFFSPKGAASCNVRRIQQADRSTYINSIDMQRTPYDLLSSTVAKAFGQDARIAEKKSRSEHGSRFLFHAKYRL